MKAHSGLVFLFFSVFFIKAHTSTLTVQSSGQQEKKMSLLIGLVGKDTDTNEVTTFAHYIKLILDRPNQKTSGFSVEVKTFEKIPTKNVLKKIAHNFPIAIFVNPNDAQFAWRMYDTRYARMVAGKKLSQQISSFKICAEYLADQVWPLLTGQEGYFSSRIAYCKEVRKEGTLAQKHLCLVTPYADPASKQYLLLSEVVVSQGRSFAPRWNKDLSNPLLLYSEGTAANVRLMSVDLQKKRKLISNFEGLNILPSYSSDGGSVVYCLSKENGKSQLYIYSMDEATHKPALKQITHNNGNNFSPVLRDNGDIVFCSDFQGKSPKICYYHALTQQIEVLTKDGYCTSPSISEKKGKLAYSKFIDGAMQIVLYDLKEKTHEQVTFGQGNKEESTWSPCGNYIAYAIDTGSSSRIAVLNLITQERSFVTAANERCSYPCWSPKFNVPLLVG